MHKDIIPPKDMELILKMYEKFGRGSFKRLCTEVKRKPDEASFIAGFMAGYSLGAEHAVFFRITKEIAEDITKRN